MADNAEQPSPLAGDEGEENTPRSPEPEDDLEAVNSPRSDGGESDYEDAPSRLEESHVPDDNDEEQNQMEAGANTTADDALKSASPNRVTSPRNVLSPGAGDETIYASASESFLSEAGDRTGEQKDEESASEAGSDENDDDTNDPLGLGEDGSLDDADEKEEGEDEGEEGELDGDEEDRPNTSAYQTEPVSSDDDLDSVQDNYTSNKKSSSDSQQNNKTEAKRTGGLMVQNGHSKSENDINHEDHVELDYEEDLDDGDKLRGDGKLDEDEKDEAEDGAYSSGSDQEATKNGEEDEDCEEGEIVDDDTEFRHEPRRLCRFFSRGHCTWGIDCRFLHPGVNDKGNYSLIEKPLGPPSMAGRLGPQPWHRPQDRPPEEEPEVEPEEEEEPPPPSPPREETAWERGLRHAKEMRKLAKKRKEQETNFEEKKMNLSLEDVENKENYRDPERVESRTPTRVYLKDPYYDNAYDSEEEYYKEETGTWQDGHYQNFEVRWTRGPDEYPPDDYRPHRGERERLREKPHYRDRRSPPPDYRFDRMRREEKHPDKFSDNRYKEGPPQKKSSSKPDIIRRDTGPSKPTRGDEWHDPWQRTNKEVPKKRPVSGSRSRSRSRGRRHRRSISSSSSYSSRSRSSSYSSRSSYSSSSYSSRSSSRSSSSRSRSPAKRRPPPNRGGPSGPAAPGPAGGGMNRRTAPTHGRGISASTKSGGPSNRSAAQKSAPVPMQKVVARVPEVARVPSVPMAGKDGPGRGPPSKGSTMKHPMGADKKSQRPEAVRPSPLGSRQGNEGQRRPAPSRSGGPPAKPGIKPGMADGRPSGEQGSRIPPGPDDRSRKPGRGIPSRMKRQASSSSSSSRSRSRSFSSSSSGSSRSSSSSSGTSSGSADSDNLYRGVGKPGRRNISPSPLRRKVPVPADKMRKQTSQPSIQDRQKPRAPNVGKGPPPDRRKMEMDRARERDRKSGPTLKQSPTKPLPQRERKESDSRVRSMVSSSSGLAPAKQTAKDPLKVSGQKQSIKLTLSNKDRPPDKGGNSSAAKKRPAAENDAPPNKKVARSPSKDVRTVSKGPPAKNPEKIASRSRADSTKSPPAAKKPAESPAKAAKVPAASKGKKSMSSRREELLQQLKAVEDAIARKRAKMN